MNDSDFNSQQDIGLLRRIGGGDHHAFSKFYDKYSVLLFSIIVKILNDSQKAEAVMLQIFTQIWNEASAYNPVLGKPASWVITLTRNKAVDHIRNSQPGPRFLKPARLAAIELPNNSLSAHEKLQSKENAQRIRSIVAVLPSAERCVIELAFFSGLTQEEIAEVLQESLGTIKTRIRLAMLRLRAKLEEFESPQTIDPPCYVILPQNVHR